MPVFSLRRAGDIMSHQGCVAGGSGLWPGKGCAMHKIQVAFQSCFSAGICAELGQLDGGSGAVEENVNGSG